MLFLGSTCIYPRDCKQPMKEEYLLNNFLEYTNEPYAISKIAGIKMCESYNIQHNTNFISVMPTNLYGPNDNFDLNNSNVIPGLMRRFHNATTNNDSHIEIWGTGKPLREFLYVDDLANAIEFAAVPEVTGKTLTFFSNKLFILYSNFFVSLSSP